MTSFDDWLTATNGQTIDVDGHYGAQCWDLWSYYATGFLGVDYPRTTTGAGGGCPDHPGFACGIWKGFDRSGLGQWFQAVGPDSPAQPGDVAIWDYGTPHYPWSHVAVVSEDRGSNVYCLTQNPGAARYGNLTKDGLLGYLRPLDQTLFGNSNIQPPRRKTMATMYYKQENGKTTFALAGDGQGKAAWLETEQQDFANKLASIHGSALQLSPDTWNLWRSYYLGGN